MKNMACRKIRLFPWFSHDFPTGSGDLFPYFPKFLSIFLIFSYMFPICSNKFSIFSPDFPYIFIHRSPTPISGYRPSVAEFQVDVGDHSTQEQLIFYGDLGTKKPTWLGNPPINKGKKMFFLYGKIIGKLWEPKLNGGFIAGKFHL